MGKITTPSQARKIIRSKRNRDGTRASYSGPSISGGSRSSSGGGGSVKSTSKFKGEGPGGGPVPVYETRGTQTVKVGEIKKETGTASSRVKTKQTTSRPEVVVSYSQTPVSRVGVEDYSRGVSRYATRSELNQLGFTPQSNVLRLDASPAQKRTPGSVQPARVSGYERFRRGLEIQQKERKGTFTGIGIGLTRAAVSFGDTLLLEPIRYGTRLVRNPIGTATETYQGVASIVRDPLGYGSQVGSAIKRDPASAFGTGAALVTGPRIYGAAGSRTSKAIRSAYVRSGSQYIPEEQVFAREVLSGRSKFPSSKGASESLTKFNQAKSGGKYTVVSAADRPLKTRGLFTREVEVGPGGFESLKNLQDRGLWTTPIGEASPVFLRVAQQSDNVRYTLNPFKTARPSLFSIETKGTSRIPKSVVDTVKYNRENFATSSVFVKRGKVYGGFEDVNMYLSAQSKKGKTFVTARSTIRDTSELESVIPEGSLLIPKDRSIRGIRKYTTYKGETVPIIEYKLVGAGSRTPRTSSVRELVSDASRSALSRSSSSYARGTSYRTPYPAASLFGSQVSRLSRGSTSRSSSPRSTGLTSLSISSPSRSTPSSSPLSSIIPSPSSPGRPTRSSPVRDSPRPPYDFYVPTPRSGGGGSSFTSGFRYGGPASRGGSSGSSLTSFTFRTTPTRKKRKAPDKNTSDNTKKKSKDPFTFKTAYQPSLEAGVFEIYGKRPSKLSERSGLTIRPILR